MIRSEVERNQRTASRPTRVPSTAPSSRTGRTDRIRSAARTGLRALVVGGFAGAAWLLCGAAAHAAQADTHSVDDQASSLVSLTPLVGAPEESTPLVPVTDTLGTASGSLLGTTSTLAGDLLAPADGVTSVVLPGGTATTADPVTNSPASGPGGGVPAGDPATIAGASGGSATAAPARDAAPTRSASGASGVTGVIGVVDGLVAPLGLTDALTGPAGLLTPLTSAIDPVVAPLDFVLAPVTALLSAVTAPVADAVGGLPAGGTGDLSGVAEEPGRSGVPGSDAIRTPVTGTAAGDGMAKAGTGTVHSVLRQYAGTDQRPAAAAVARTGAGQAPDLPVPVRGYLGSAGHGIPAGAGSPSEGGAFAVIPSAVAGNPVAFHRLPVSTEVEALGIVAESPTFSPD
ncbi:hypothetical protein [Polymorphospora lycopeni]|uniref:Uncharacterized protein n=1 Tax=Polymorphospora lycopeni TaxID=3140240 RepID=A0ABV5CHQ6_9ACTN